MPSVANNPAINAKRFAALLAGFDTGNSSEQEAVAKGLALRRMAAAAGMRVVDVMELPDVKQAIDDQLRPNRQEGPALQQALEQAAQLQEELTERTRDTRQLAELLKEQKEKNEELDRELEQARSAGSNVPSPFPSPVSAPRAVLPGNDGSMIAAVLALVLLLAAVFGGHFYEGGHVNGVGNREGVSAPGVHKSGAVRALPKRGAVHNRVHSGGPTDRPR
jgi:hypothetical protein